MGFTCISAVFYCFQLKSCFFDEEHVKCYLTVKSQWKMRSGSILPRAALGQKGISQASLRGFICFIKSLIAFEANLQQDGLQCV